MWGRFAIPEKYPFREEEIEVLGNRVRPEPLSGADSRDHARDGARREHGGDSIRRNDLVSTLFSLIRFLHGKYIFRCRRVRSVYSPEPGDLLNTLIGSTEENFIVINGFPATGKEMCLGPFSDDENVSLRCRGFQGEYRSAS